MKTYISSLCRRVVIMLSVALIAGLTACKDKSEELVDPNAPAPRLVLVYMVADNSLGYQEYDLQDINEMLSAASNGDLGNSRLLIYHSTRNNDPKLLEVTPDSLATIKVYDNSTPSVTYSRMKSVIADAKEAAPANSFGIILWGHGSGWLENGMSEPGLEVKSFGSDRNGRWMNMTTLAEVLKDENTDWIYFDCCYMASVEVVYELRHVTPYIVGSAIELPAAGMPYDENLRCLMPANSDLLQACRNTFNLYNGKVGADRTCTMTLVSTAGLDNLAEVSREVLTLGTELPEGFRPQKYMVSNNCYHYDLKHYLEALMPDNDELCDRWNAALSEVVLYADATPYIWNDVAITNHCGLSTFILKDAVSATDRNHYERLQWWKDVVSHRFN